MAFNGMPPPLRCLHSLDSPAVMSGGIRTIEYEVVPWSDLSEMGDLAMRVSVAMGKVTSVGILRGIAEDGERVAFLGNAEVTTKMVSSGATSDPAGITKPRREFPVVLTGWPCRLRDK